MGVSADVFRGGVLCTLSAWVIWMAVLYGRMDDALTATIDDWRKMQDDEPSRPEAIRRLVELGLKAKK